MEYCNSGPSGPSRPDQGCGLETLCERFKGQPIECLISDGTRYCGIELAVFGDGVEIIDKCNRIVFIPFRHIDAIVEPMMKLTNFCGERDCECRRDEDCCEGRGDRD